MTATATAPQHTAMGRLLDVIERAGNTATALIMIPIGVSAANELGVDVRPVLMALSVACSAALLTPIATPVNLIAMGAAGYRFGDYWKLGILVMAVFFVVAVFLVPVFWPF